MWYLRGEAWSPVSAKDIRILHMKEWLLKTMKQNYEIFMHFERALGNHHFMADCVNIFSALIRNGVAYAYLIGQVLAGPDIVSRGFVYVRGAETLMEEAKQVLDERMQYCMDKGITDWGKIKTEIKDSLSDFVWKETKRRPMIMPIIMEV